MPKIEIHGLNIKGAIKILRKLQDAFKQNPRSRVIYHQKHPCLLLVTTKNPHAESLSQELNLVIKVKFLD